MNATQFQNLIRRTLLEEVEQRKNALNGDSPARVPEMDANGIDSTKKPKTFGTDSNSRDVASKEALVTDLKRLTSEIDEEITVMWDDHDDLMVNSRDLKFIRISPRWEDYYVIEMMTRNEDRIWVTGQSWEQVKDFVKVNLKNDDKYPTSVEKAYDKSYRSREDQTPTADKGLSQKDKPKILPLTNEKPSETKNKEKNYTEKQVKSESDLPEKPMRESGKFEKQIDHKVKDPVKLRRRTPDTKLTVSLSKQSTGKL